MIPPRAPHQKGIALIFVLMLIVLVTIVIVAFFTSVKTESSATNAAMGIQNSRQLADLATQVVVSQIQQATQTSSTRKPGTVSWASQPGMIRCYDNTGAETEWYKLYSAQTMTVSNPSPSLSLIQADLPETSGTAGNWAAVGSPNYGVFTDINSPVIAADGTTLEYPVMDPSGATSTASSSNVIYGFDIQNPPGYTSGNASSATNNQAPMPVRWLYVLQNGKMVPGVASGTSGTVTVAGASSSNPVVGRVAFWTDDETCKLNINTAADGTYFDSPRFQNGPLKTSATLQAESGTTQDSDRVNERQLAVSPPVANECQRYVGHPAQTRLSYVLPGIFSLNGLTRSKSLSQISPFYQWGGSQGGTVTEYDLTANGGTFSGALATPNRQTPYATLDEWLFSTGITGSGTSSTRTLNTDLSGNQLVTNTRLQQLRFFLSANSEGPEVNLFGQPRICMYPIYTPTLNTNALPTLPDNHVSTFDQLIATCSTLYGVSAANRAPGGTQTTPYTYYIGRQNSASPYTDFDGSSASTMPRPSMSISSGSSNTRNQNLFVFLRNLASHAVPGYGHSFTDKYATAGMDQILTEVFDYIRSSNPNDYLVTTPYNITRVDAVTTTNGHNATAGLGQVTPLIIGSGNFGNQYSTQGFGRFYTVSEIGVNFTQSQPTLLSPSGTVDPTHVTLTPVIYLGLFSPSLGPTEFTPDMRIEIVPAGLQALTLNGMKMFDATPKIGNTSKSTFSVIPLTGGSDTTNTQFMWHDNTPGGYNGTTSSIFLWGGAVGPRLTYAMKRTSYNSSPAQASPGGNNGSTTLGTRNNQNYMFSGIPLNVPAAGPFTFNGGAITIKIYHNNAQANDASQGDGNSGASYDLVQTLNVTLPAITFTKALTPVAATATPLSTSLAGSEYETSTPFSNSDLGISLVAGYNGDFRLLSAQNKITVTTTTAGSGSAFIQHPSFSASGGYVHSMRDPFLERNFCGNSGAGFTSTGQILDPSKVTLPANQQVVGNITSYPTTGDWDNGIGAFPDGPYINKADEAGAQYTTYTVPYYTGGFSGSAIRSAVASPNRILASPVMFGSLPTGVPVFNPAGTAVTTATPWQTLLFRPQAGHPGGNNSGTTIADELLLDWFWMPVVQPYAISTPFATSGKVNMNYQIAPFTYITRATALMGVLGSEYVISAANTMGSTYKNQGTNNTGGGSGNVYRYPVKVLENDGLTLGDTTGSFRPFKDRFATGQIFRSAAEICDIYLVPQGQSWSSWAQPGSPTSGSDAETYWNSHLLTGDNSRERPYNGLYSRLTTKSNTYTVHVRAQALKQPSATPDGVWIENPQLIVSEYRGSVTINRYLDPQDTNIPDFLSTGTNYPVSSSTGAFKYSLDNYYKYRVVETRQFVP